MRRPRPLGVFRLLRANWLRLLGTYSYAIYLFHKPLHDLVGTPILKRMDIDASQSTTIKLLYLACSAVALLLVALLSYSFVERPFLRMKAGFQAASG